MGEAVIRIGSEDTAEVILRRGAIDVAELTRALSFRPEGYHFSPQFRAGNWDGWVSLYKKGKFPVGLSSDVTAFLKQRGFTVTYQDARRKPSSAFRFNWTGPSMRPYQADAVTQAVSSTRGNIIIGTGGGKMVVAARIIQQLSVRTILFVNSTEALHDTYNELCACISGATIAKFGDGDHDIGDITVATVQAYGKSPALDAAVANADCLILDECHHAAAKTWYEFGAKSSAYYKFGMTGTLKRGDEKEIYLRAFSGRPLCNYPVRWLIDNGYLCEVDIHFHKIEYEGDELSLIRAPVSDRYKMAIIQNPARTRKIREILAAAPELSSVVLVRHVEHGELLSQELGAPFVSGSMRKALRREIKEGINSGAIKTVIATSLYDESVNNPIWKLCINAAGYSPENAQIQRLGRILRKVGDLRAQFHDFIDVTEDGARLHSKARMQYLKEEGHEIQTH